MNILQPLIERLKTEGPSSWERIAAEAGVAKTLPRKLVYGDRENPRVQTVQPLLDYFARIDQIKRRPSKQKAEA